MQAIILAAGEGTRLVPLTLTTPKPLMSFAGTSPLLHTLDELNGIVDEAVIVIGYKGDVIEKTIGSRHGDIKISYIRQQEPKGTGDALIQARTLLQDKFLVLNADDVYQGEDLAQVAKYCPSIMAFKVEDPKEFGVLETRDGILIGIEEKPEDPKSNFVNTGVYCLPKSVFDEQISLSERGEYELTDFVKILIEKSEVHCINASSWLPITFPWHILNANEYILSSLRKGIKGKVEKNVSISGKVKVEEGTVIKSGTYIEGPVFIGRNCKIGPNAYLRGPLSIGDNCHIGNVEIKDSVIGSGSSVVHFSYIGDSVIGSNVNVAAGSLATNLRHDGTNVKSMVKGKIVDTGRQKFGTVIGDNVKLGVNTIIYPGRKIWPGKTTLPGEILKEDLQ